MVVMKERPHLTGVIEHWLYKIESNFELANYHFVLIVCKVIPNHLNNPKKIFIVEEQVLSDISEEDDRNTEVAHFDILEQAIQYAAEYYPRINTL